MQFRTIPERVLITRYTAFEKDFSVAIVNEKSVKSRVSGNSRFKFTIFSLAKRTYNGRQKC